VSTLTPRRADRRSSTNRNDRGGSHARRVRRRWLVTEFGDGVHVACFQQRSPRCLYVLDETNVSPDRIIPGCEGGTYRRGNILPSCLPCQEAQGGELGQARRWLDSPVK
jgi:hypothetical protein